MSDWTQALKAAQFAARRGLFVFPLARSKRPAISTPHADLASRNCRGECGQLGHGVHDAANDPEWTRELFEAAPWATAYGIACGRAPHHLVGIDLDVKHGIDGPTNLKALAAEHGFDIPPTATVATPSGGLHLWFTAPPQAQILNSQSKLAPGIDVRGSAGYLVGPYSRTHAGLYTFAPGTDPNTIAEVPEALLALLTRPAEAPTMAPQPEGLRERVHHQSAYVRAVLDGEDAKVRAQTKPGRKNRLWASAAAIGRLVGDGTVPEPLAFDVLLSAGLATGLDQRTVERTIRSGFARATTGRAA
ncbi:bifunctional DNA primase/polymerase [Kitasatospora sp. NPDC101183]|uniref:bifunctional DNA primase/polymerase n=1 Tax=Kitasatospora sp. NPDC101183 TaxID=3364100 RepID=UPI0038063977